MTDNSPIETPARQVARHKIRKGIQHLIVSGQQRPGTKLVQQDLARHFGVAQGVIREALLELQSCGLVETFDNRGIFVSELSIAKLIEAYDVREMHEALAVRLCCDRITRGQLRELADLAEQIYAMSQQQQLDQMGSLDRDFHYRLLEISGNSMLKRLADNYRVLGKIIRVNRDAAASRDEHLAILKAIELGHTDEAEHQVRKHIRAGKDALQQQVAEGEFVPQWVV